MGLAFLPELFLETLEPFLGAPGFAGAPFPFVVGRLNSLPGEGFGVEKGCPGLTILTVGYEGFTVLQNLLGGPVACGSQFGGTAGMGFGEGRARGFQFPVWGGSATVAEEDKEKRWKKKSAHATVFVGR